jgi:ribose 5-phosphate isomerase B
MLCYLDHGLIVAVKIISKRRDAVMEMIAIANDHAGAHLKAEIVSALQDLGFEVLDLGVNTPESVDYPDYGYALAAAIESGQVVRGVLVCGTGIGIAMAANRFPAVRAATCSNATQSRLARQHNDANVLALGERTTGVEVALECLRVFLHTAFDGGRHQRRVGKLSSPPDVST